MKTIVVDDEKWMIEQFRYECAHFSCLELCGAYSSPLDALEYVGTTPVDAAFIDIEMPEMNGFELARRLRMISPGITIIIVSAYEQYREQALAAGCTDLYLLKPYSSRDFADTVNAVLCLKGERP